MATIKKDGDKVTLTMTTQEALLLGDMVNNAGNMSARLRYRSRVGNQIIHRDSEICMNQMWRLSDHLSIPDDPKHSYTMDFNLP